MMHGRRRVVAVVALVGSTVAAGAIVAAGIAGPDVDFTNVAAANPKSAGNDPPNILSPELQEIEWARGSMLLENAKDGVKAYGYDDDGKPFVPVLGPATGAGGNLTLLGGTRPEAQKTEPDKNTYLVLKGQAGADPNYNYGTHFLFQGHEAGSPGYITRINLDADGAHRVTLIAAKDVNGTNLRTFDGSTWDPWAERLLFTSEAGPSGTPPVSQGGVWQSTLDGRAVDMRRYLGRGGMEGIQNDDEGNLYYFEDVGGASPFASPDNRARVPNSFVYRFIPSNRSDLTKGGEIQALQVLWNGNPITVVDAASGPNPDAYKALHTYGNSLKTKWVTLVANSASLGSDADLNALAKQAPAAGQPDKRATPFKRPENGLFQPGSHFTELFFDETGDTNAQTTAGPTGGFGSIFRLTQSPKSDDGMIRLFYLGDVTHSSFDNNAFFSDTQVAFVEDGGDTLHGSPPQGHNALDSAWLFDTTVGYSKGAQPVRFIAQGRDPSATIDSAIGGVYSTLFPAPPPNPEGFFNDGDNEITGIHVSDGDPTKNGILGAKSPKPFRGNERWRAFYTQQHGDNVTYELISSGD